MVTRMNLSIVIRAAALLAMVISLSATVNAISPVGISWTDTPHKDAEPAATKPAATSRPAAVAGAARFAELNRIDLFDLRRQMDAGLPLTLLDARPAYEFAQGHLPGAVSLPWGQVEGGTPWARCARSATCSRSTRRRARSTSWPWAWPSSRGRRSRTSTRRRARSSD